MNHLHSLLLVSSLALVAPAVSFAGINSLSNPSFETGLTDWVGSPEGGYAASAGSGDYPLGIASHHGTKFAQFYPSSGATVSIRQDVTSGVAPGQLWTFSGFVLNPAGYEVVEGNFGRVRIEYLGGTGPTMQKDIDVRTDPLGTWIPFTYTTPAPTPEWITGVRFWAEYVQPVPLSGGMMAYDDLSAISEVPELPTTGLIGAGAALLMAGVHRWKQNRAVKPGAKS